MQVKIFNREERTNNTKKKSSRRMRKKDKENKGDTKMGKAALSTSRDLFSFSPVFPSLPEDADNMNNFATLLGKLSKVWQGRLKVINYSNVSSEPCCLRRAGLYNMHVRRHDETTP